MTMRLGTLNFWFILGGKVAARPTLIGGARHRRMEAIGRESTKRMMKDRAAGVCPCTRTCLQENSNT